jgi:hypothetical protein
MIDTRVSWRSKETHGERRDGRSIKMRNGSKCRILEQEGRMET